MEEAERIYSMPLRELSADDLQSYARHALTTWGGIEDFKHFIPRMFDLLWTEPEWTDTAILLTKLQSENWRLWPDSEQAGIENFPDRRHRDHHQPGHQTERFSPGSQASRKQKAI